MPLPDLRFRAFLPVLNRVDAVNAIERARDGGRILQIAVHDFGTVVGQALWPPACQDRA